MTTRVEQKTCNGLKLFDYNEDIFNQIDNIKKAIANNEAVVVKNVIAKNILLDIKRYLLNVGTNSMPSYHALDKKIQDHHLILNNHPDSYVESYVHKFYFYPWNQNIFDFFNVFKPIFQIKNLITNLDKDEFFINNPLESDFVLRCVFHHYPLGGGYIARHADTVGVHQAVTAITALSDKGVDFSSGGLYIVDKDGNKLFVDDELKMGNVLFFNPEIVHGVDDIQGKTKGGFFDINGRWIMIAATIKTVKNKHAKTAIQLDDN